MDLADRRASRTAALLGMLAASLLADPARGLCADGVAAFEACLAADRQLRRTKYPLTVKLIECNGAGGEAVPVTLSVG
ncbi:MAG: hypothetical protein WBF17_02190, partial [Phycisphaerae bacterium]